MCGCGWCGSFLYRCARALAANNPDDDDDDATLASTEAAAARLRQLRCCQRQRRRRQRRSLARRLQRYKRSSVRARLIAASFAQSLFLSLSLCTFASLALSHSRTLPLSSVHLALALGVCACACNCNCCRAVAWLVALPLTVLGCFVCKQRTVAGCGVDCAASANACVPKSYHCCGPEPRLLFLRQLICGDMFCIFRRGLQMEFLPESSAQRLSLSVSVCSSVCVCVGSRGN